MISASCGEIEPRLVEFLGGELPPVAAQAVRAHLLDCSSCRREASAWQRANQQLVAAANAAVPGIDDAALHADILAAVATASEQRGWVRSPRGWWLGLAAGLAAVGFWYGAASPDDSVWSRPATALGTLPQGMATHGAAGTPVLRAVPWSGPRVPMRLLGNEFVGGDATLGEPEAGVVRDGARAGMRGRHLLRTLENVLVPLPPAESDGNAMAKPRRD